MKLIIIAAVAIVMAFNLQYLMYVGSCLSYFSKATVFTCSKSWEFQQHPPVSMD